VELVAGGEDEEEEVVAPLQSLDQVIVAETAKDAELTLAPDVPAVEEVKLDQTPAADRSIDEVMGAEDAAAKAAVLQPMEGTGESFELWESGSFKDDVEAVALLPPPIADDVPVV
jgi:hypothetical protein